MGAAEKILKLHNQIALVDSAISKATNVSELARIARLETRLRNLCSSTWNNRADQSSEKAAKLVAQGKTTREIISTINKEMDKWSKDILPRFLKDFEEIYGLSRSAGWRKANKQTKASLSYNTRHIKTITKADVPQYLPKFDLVDKEAVEALKNHQVFWIGTHYKNNVSHSIADVARKTMVETAGMDRMRASKVMQKTIREQFRKVEIPARWSGTDRQYFEGLTANAATVARVHGQMRSFMDLGITKYEIMNPNDSRTCEVCLHMNHKVFTVENGRQVMESELNAKTPNQVKRAHPWVRSKELEKLSPMPGAVGPKDAASLAGAGFCLPPFHFRCRCTVDVSVEAGSWSGYREQTDPPRVQPPRGQPKEPPPSRTRPAHFPEMNDHVTKPRGEFNAARMLSALQNNVRGSHKLKPGAQATVRRELNALCANEGMVSYDVQANRKLASRFDVKTADEIFVETGGRGVAFHDWAGRVACTTDQVDDCIVMMKEVVKKGQSNTQVRAGFKTMLHEAIHGHSAQTPKVYQTWGIVVEEGSCELATKRILNKHFKQRWQDGYSYRLFVDGLSEAAENSLKKVLGYKYRGAFDEFVKKNTTEVGFGVKAKSYAGHEMASKASIQMRRTGKAAKNSEKLTKDFSNSFELPDEIVAGMEAKEVEKLTEEFRKDLFKSLWGTEDNPGKLNQLFIMFTR